MDEGCDVSDDEEIEKELELEIPQNSHFANAAGKHLGNARMRCSIVKKKGPPGGSANVSLAGGALGDLSAAMNPQSQQESFSATRKTVRISIPLRKLMEVQMLAQHQSESNAIMSSEESATSR